MPPACLLYPRFHSIISFLKVDPLFVFEGSSGLPWPGQQHSGYKVSVSKDCYPYLVFAAPTVDEEDWLWRWHDMLYTHGMIWNVVLMISRPSCAAIIVQRISYYFWSVKFITKVSNVIYSQQSDFALILNITTCSNVIAGWTIIVLLNYFIDL